MGFQKIAVFGLLVVSVMASLLQTSNSTKQWNFPEIPPSKELKWYPCFEGFFCTVLDVPLDYSKETPDRAFVPIIKYPATTSPYKGMLISNPGGPGDSGVAFLRLSYQTLAQVVGSNYDIVSWEPRGVGYSIPSGNCTLPASLRRRTADKIYGPEFPAGYFETAFQEAKIIGAACEASIGAFNQAGPHMTTATTAHDIVSILDAFKESAEGKRSDADASLLNYWGFSYGTMLGQTFASMFPERVGRMMLDGVVRPDTYLSGLDVLDVTFVDSIISTFFLYCSLAGSSICPFATGSTPYDVYLRFENILGRLNASYAIEQGWSNATAIEAALVGLKQMAFSVSYSPIERFPLAAIVLNELEGILPNLTTESLNDWDNPYIAQNVVRPPALWQRGIWCSDTKGVLFNRTLQQLQSAIRNFEVESYIAGEGWATHGIECTGWPIVSDYTFSGPFGGKTKNPILFVSNTLDPVTPIMNGQNGASIFDKAQLLTIEGTGHTSNAPQNKCGYAKMNTFLQTGRLPGKDNFCKLEMGPFNVSYSGPLAKRADWMGIWRLLKA